MERNRSVSPKEVCRVCEVNPTPAQSKNCYVTGETRQYRTEGGGPRTNNIGWRLRSGCTTT